MGGDGICDAQIQPKTAGPVAGARAPRAISKSQTSGVVGSTKRTGLSQPEQCPSPLFGGDNALVGSGSDLNETIKSVALLVAAQDCVATCTAAGGNVGDLHCSPDLFLFFSTTVIRHGLASPRVLVAKFNGTKTSRIQSGHHDVPWSPRLNPTESSSPSSGVARRPVAAGMTSTP
jgi:hypothetical protein